MALPKFLKERTDKPLAERYVNMSNALARSAHSLTLAEKRVVAIGLAKTDSIPAKLLIDASIKGWAVRVDAAEYAELFGVESSAAYEALQTAAINLLKRQVRLFEETPKGIKERGINWCAEATYHHGEGWVSIHFTHSVAPHLLALRGEFISYKLMQGQGLRSIYSWRLMECLQTWRSTGMWNVSMEEFMEAMDAPPSCQKDFKALRIRVIEPAVKELLAKNGLSVTWEPKRTGRKVIGLSFKFEQAKQSVLEFA